MPPKRPGLSPVKHIMVTSAPTRPARPSSTAAGAGRIKTRRRMPRQDKWLTASAAKLAAIAALPALFVRVAVFAYSSGDSTFISVAGAGAVVLVVLALLVGALSKGITGRISFWSLVRWVSLPAVVLWSAYALFYLSQANAKTAGVRSAYTSLHPVLRLAVASAIVTDGDLVVTDAKRTAEDYRRMGLPVFERTMHYPQRDSWVHAIDVRTIGHGRVRNFALAWYFRAV